MTTGTIITGNKKYTITRKITPGDRPNANIYLCEDEFGKSFIAKHFYKKRPMPNIAYGKRNHYGRRRDGSRLIFGEIKIQSNLNDFLIDHIERFKHNGKWIIILEYIDGSTFTEFIKKHRSDHIKTNGAVIKLAETLSKWHRNGFAHGDPHLDNCMIEITDSEELKVSLIDYCQLHHKNFKYCQKYDCFTSNKNRRFKEDLKNDTGYFGKGFRTGIVSLEKEIGYGSSLSELFDKHYSIGSN